MFIGLVSAVFIAKLPDRSPHYFLFSLSLLKKIVVQLLYGFCTVSVCSWVKSERYVKYSESPLK